MADSGLEHTVLHAWHRDHATKMGDFGGFDMPIVYGSTIAEHLATRSAAGLFDVSHMGRFIISGEQAVDFAQHVLTNNADALDEVGMAQYTLIPDDGGNAVDDAYLYRVGEDRYMLVVNASNRKKDWDHLQQYVDKFPQMEFEDVSEEMAMIALQGPKSTDIIKRILAEPGNTGSMPDIRRNRLSEIMVGGNTVTIARTGYTGEPICYEIFAETGNTVDLWEKIMEVGEEFGVKPVGLGARDTLRLEAGLPLYGHELGDDIEGNPIPILSNSLTKIAVSFVPEKGDYVGKAALLQQAKERRDRDDWQEKYETPLEERVLKKVVMPMAIMDDSFESPGRIPARQGYEVYLVSDSGNRLVGHITSGTVVPSWEFSGQDVSSTPTETKVRRPIALAYLDADLFPHDPGQSPGEWQKFIVKDPKSGRESNALIVNENMRAGVPYVHAVIHPERVREAPVIIEKDWDDALLELIREAAHETQHRQFDSFNLIPSENTPSPVVRALTTMDYMGRYAEHQQVPVFGLDSPDVEYYQGAGRFAIPKELMLQAAQAQLMGAQMVEVRPVTGQGANEGVFSGKVRWKNIERIRGSRVARMDSVLAHLLGRGGHLSSQYFGALRDTVEIDPKLDRPGVHAFPVLDDDMYQIDLDRAYETIARVDPELIVLGKSMILYREPVEQIANFIREHYKGRPTRPVLMMDAAHVKGLLGPHYQRPLAEGADIITGSTHKTEFGTQRGIIASNMIPGSEYYEFWQAITEREFPGKLSNHHIGTLVGLLGASYEELKYGDGYQRQVITNAKAFAQALKDEGIHVEGNSEVGYTETHQVVMRVGNGPRMARRLEKNNIYTNYQALPDDLGFTDASGIRMGVQEMTRFGMEEEHFGHLAHLIADVIIRNKDIRSEVALYRHNFTQMKYTLPADKADVALQEMRDAWLAI